MLFIRLPGRHAPSVLGANYEYHRKRTDIAHISCLHLVSIPTPAQLFEIHVELRSLAGVHFESPNGACSFRYVVFASSSPASHTDDLLNLWMI